MFSMQNLFFPVATSFPGNKKRQNDCCFATISDATFSPCLPLNSIWKTHFSNADAALACFFCSNLQFHIFQKSSTFCKILKFIAKLNNWHCNGYFCGCQILQCFQFKHVKLATEIIVCNWMGQRFSSENENILVHGVDNSEFSRTISLLRFHCYVMHLALVAYLHVSQLCQNY